MTYDLKRLDASEFENLCNDILEREIGIRFQGFPTGPDSGIDGYNAEKNIVMQSKHYIKSTISDVNLKKEKIKMDKKKPKEYFYFTSEPITLKRKGEIKKIISPYIKSTDDVWSFNDIQDFLSKTENFDIVKKYNSLFIYSTEVLSEVLKNNNNQSLLNRTKSFVEELKENVDRYIKTSDFYKALKKLEEDNVVLITGEAGIGKTTLTGLLSLEYVKEGYVFYKIAEIKELESVTIDNNDKIIFYFDDFLGKNFLEVISNNEDSRIMSFLNKTKRSKNKKFILNSRATIYQESKILSPDNYEKLDRDEYVLKINNLEDDEKKYILYKHLLYSGLPIEYKEKVFKDKKYLEIVNHKNFNPRLIDFILDNEKIIDKLSISEDKYFDYIIDTLKNPKHIWDNYFKQNTREYSKALVFLVIFNGSKITDSKLRKSYNDYIKLKNIDTEDKYDYEREIQVVTRSLLRPINKNGILEYTLFNPSIADYVIETYFNDEDKIILLLKSLGNVDSLKFYSLIMMRKIDFKDKFSASLGSLNSKILETSANIENIQSVKKVQLEIFEYFYEKKILEKDWEYILFLLNLKSKNIQEKKIKDFLEIFINQDILSTNTFTKFSFSDFLNNFHEDYNLKYEKYDFLWNFIVPGMSQFEFEELFEYIDDEINKTWGRFEIETYFLLKKNKNEYLKKIKVLHSEKQKKIDNLFTKDFLNALSEKYSAYVHEEINDNYNFNFVEDVSINKDWTEDDGIHEQLEVDEESMVQKIFDYIEEIVSKEKNIKVLNSTGFSIQGIIDSYDITELIDNAKDDYLSDNREEEERDSANSMDHSLTNIDCLFENFDK